MYSYFRIFKSDKHILIFHGFIRSKNMDILVSYEIIRIAVLFKENLN